MLQPKPTDYFPCGHNRAAYDERGRLVMESKYCGCFPTSQPVKDYMRQLGIKSLRMPISLFESE